MSRQDHPLAAVHYFYLLKEDQEDLAKMWSSLTSEMIGRPERPLPLELAELQESPAGLCKILQRVRGEDLDLCLIMLTDLSVMQILYHGPSGVSLRERWTEVMRLVENDRERVASEGLTIFGETTLLVSSSEPEPGFSEIAARICAAGVTLKSKLDPEAAGGGHPILVNLLAHRDHSRDLFALAALDPEPIVSTMFPQVDSLIKKLTRSSAYFEEQRKTIVRERTQIDREIGTLLHRQVVSKTDTPTDATLELEKRIVSLSRMFGMLATDLLLCHQSGERLEKDIALLVRGLKQMLGSTPEAADDEIGSHYLDRFKGELTAVRDENLSLDFSRQNAQAAIEVMRTHVELLRAGEEAGIQEQTRQLLSRSLLLQKERLALQVAAGFIEFVVVFYYLLRSWEGIAGMQTLEHIAPVARMMVVGGMSGAAAVGTHFLAQALQSGSWKNRWLWASAAFLVLSFAGMVILSIINS